MSVTEDEMLNFFDDERNKAFLKELAEHLKYQTFDPQQFREKTNELLDHEEEKEKNKKLSHVASFIVTKGTNFSRAKARMSSGVQEMEDILRELDIDPKYSKNKVTAESRTLSRFSAAYPEFMLMATVDYGSKNTFNLPDSMSYLAFPSAASIIPKAELEMAEHHFDWTVEFDALIKKTPTDKTKLKAYWSADHERALFSEEERIGLIELAKKKMEAKKNSTGKRKTTSSESSSKSSRSD